MEKEILYTEGERLMLDVINQLTEQNGELQTTVANKENLLFNAFRKLKNPDLSTPQLSESVKQEYDQFLKELAAMPMQVWYLG